MRSPGARRIIHTRVRSVSDSSVEPTQGFGFALSRSNSAAMSAGHFDFSLLTAALSSMVKAMANSSDAICPYIEHITADLKIEALLPGSTAKRAIVIGGSMSGLLAGLLLRRTGWRVDIYERVGSELSGRGAGIVAQQELIARLGALGLPTAGLGVEITTRKILDAAGRVTEEVACPQV